MYEKISLYIKLIKINEQYNFNQIVI